MKATRYIITRPCLQEGSLRLLKYLAGTFPNAGPVVLVDDRGQEHTGQVDLDRGRILGVGSVYQAQNLGVNDVLMITPLAPGRYQVEAIVKPYAPPPAPRRDAPPKPQTRRVVVSTTPHVREVRLQEVRQEVRVDAARAAEPAPDLKAAPPKTTDTKAAEPQVADVRASEVRSSEVRSSEIRSSEARASEARSSEVPVLETRRPESRAAGKQQAVGSEPQQAAAGQRVAPRAAQVTAVTPQAPQQAAQRPVRTPAAPVGRSPEPVKPSVEPLDVRFETAPSSAPEQLALLARLTGYRLEDLGSGVMRMTADLGPHGYSVLVALTEAAVRSAAWKEPADYCVLLTAETDRPVNTPRLTREALEALTEHAQLAPLSPVDLRGYWKAGSVDLESAASVAELVGAYLAQRGAFSMVLLTLAQQPARSVVSVQRLAERLGSGVHYAELGSILETLTRAPFLALTPLPGGHYLLRVGVDDLLAELAEYAGGVRRRVRGPKRDAVSA